MQKVLEMAYLEEDSKPVFDCVLEAEDDLEDLRRGVGDEVKAHAAVRAVGAEEHVVLDRTRRVDFSWVGEVIRL